MTEMGQGLQIVNVTESHSFVLEERELEQLLLREDVRDLPVVVVSVAGAYRGGKSFLLNFFLRYLSAPKEAREDGSWLGENSAPLAGFNWRSGVKATTMGILMWSQPFIMALPSGENVAILLVDTQGSFDSRSTVRENSTVFALSTLISSIQIYNLSMNIQEDDLQHLEITDDLPNEMKELRQHIRSSFNKVSGFLMPHPGFKVLSSTFKGNISDIEPEFRMHLKDLVNSIFGPEKLLPKTIHGERVKARDLFNYFKTYMELFNSDEIPSPTNILAATVKAGVLSAVSEARDIYEKGMDSECGPMQLSVPAVDLKYLHEKYVALACASYSNKKKMGSAQEIAEYLRKLTKDLNERLPQFQQSNLSKIQSAIERANDTYDETFKNISKDEPLCVHSEDVEKVHKAGVDAALKIYDAARKRVTDKNEDERATFIQGFEKKFEYQQRINKQSNTFLVNELKNAYWMKMQAKSAVYPPLSETIFKHEHDVALSKALEDFHSKRNLVSYYAEDIYKYNLMKNIAHTFSDLGYANGVKNRQLRRVKAEEVRRSNELQRLREANYCPV